MVINRAKFDRNATFKRSVQNRDTIAQTIPFCFSSSPTPFSPPLRVTFKTSNQM